VLEVEAIAMMAVAPKETAPVFLLAPFGFWGELWIRTVRPNVSKVAGR
jgi:hypothetical protein